MEFANIGLLYQIKDFVKNFVKCGKPLELFIWTVY